MSESTRRRVAGGLLGLPLLVLAFGCGQKPVAPVSTQAAVAEHAEQTPGEIELSDAKVTVVEPTLVRFEVKYRFTKGQPDKFYACDISFPGTPNHGVKPMESWELKKEGVIKDGVVLREPPVKTFEIHMSETTSPQLPYKKISNVLTGSVP